MFLFRYIKNLAGIPGILFRVHRNLKTQKSFIQQELEPYLQKTMFHNDGSLTDRDVSKILRYYGLAVPGILGEAFAALRGSPLTEQERRGSTWLGATTGLFDDFFENTSLTDGYIELLYREPAMYTGNNSNEKLANYCWRLALKHAANPDLLTDMAAMVHRSQSDSRLQKRNNPGKEALRKITRDKGGFSVLFYMAFYYRNLPPGDEKLFYEAGALLQLENDLFDVYKDHQDAITTLVTSGIKIADIRTIYLNGWTHIKSALNQTSFSPKAKKQFLQILCGLVSRGQVCLDMLQKRENENKGLFNPAVFTRKQLICDMEKPVNLLRTIHYYAKML